jgi:hypothetical protein
MFSLYDALFADQDLDDVLLNIELPPDDPLYAARAQLWEGDYRAAGALAAGTVSPWSSFIQSAARMHTGQDAARTLMMVADDPDNETRIRLWAWRALRQIGTQPTPLQLADVLGIAVEVPIGPGSDVLAAYADGRVRYFNHAGSATIREETPARPQVQDLLSKAYRLMAVPPAERRKEEVPPDRVRFTALAADGLHCALGAAKSTT